MSLPIYHLCNFVILFNLLVRDVIYTSCAYATMSVFVYLSVCLWRMCIGEL